MHAARFPKFSGWFDIMPVSSGKNFENQNALTFSEGNTMHKNEKFKKILKSIFIDRNESKMLNKQLKTIEN